MRVESIGDQLRQFGKKVIPYPVRSQLVYQYEIARKITETKRIGLFGAVQIEINTNCNRRCSYCPNSISPKDPALMRPETYHRITEELREMDFHGRIMPHCMSEPLMHPELPQLMAEASMVKQARIIIFTNGDFLNQRRFDELKRAGVDAFVITQHGQQAPRPLLDLLAYLKPDKQTGITFRNLHNSRLFNRGIPGLIEPNRRAIPNPCCIADCYIQILVNGDVPQCYNDIRGEEVFGNVNRKSIIEIWNDPAFKTFRNKVRSGQFESKVCQRCVFDTSAALQGEALGG